MDNAFLWFDGTAFLDAIAGNDARRMADATDDMPEDGVRSARFGLHRP